MSTVVCRNIQSSIDTLLVEPRSLSLKLNPPKHQCLPSSDSSTAGWSCIESLSNASNLYKETTNKLEVYVHPLVKRSSSMLNEKGLKMCTENLGSETGTDVASEDDIFSIQSLDSEAEEIISIIRREEERTITKLNSRTTIQSRKAGYESLPPPLTTISGTNTFRVQPHRESGRLVMTAVTSCPRRSSVLVERCNGRLTMSLNEHFFEESNEEEDEAQEEELIDEIGCEKKEEDEEEEEDGWNNGASLEEDSDVINKEVGDKFVIGEFQRLTRCKEGGRGTRRLINLKAFWVAT